MDYEIKNGWIFCEVCVDAFVLVDGKQVEMGIDAPNEWNKMAIQISSINNFRGCDNDEDFIGCSTVYDGKDSFTITVPFDDLKKIIFGV